MAVAPGLFTPARADAALLATERQLLGGGQLGVKTLDPGDWAFRGEYSAGAKGEKAVAGGWNYHQGPEWLWPYGFYLRARLHFPPQPLAAADGARWASSSARRQWVLSRLARQRAHVEGSAEGALPELTNAGGGHCPDSCAVQAWSGATLLDALEDLRAAEAAGV